MTECLLDNFNSRVKDGDRVYNLGDLTMRRGNKDKEWFRTTVRKMNGTQILFPGNHDHFDAEDYLEAGFEDIRATWRDDLGFVYSHIPIHPDSMGSAKGNIHGHIHDAADYAPVRVNGRIQPYINISVEKTDYKPIHLDELIALYNRKVEYWRELGEIQGTE